MEQYKENSCTTEDTRIKGKYRGLESKIEDLQVQIS